RLAARRTGRQAIVVGSLESEGGGHMRRCRVQFLLVFGAGAVRVHAASGKSAGVQGVLLRQEGLAYHGNVTRKVDASLPGTQVDAQARPVHAGAVRQPSMVEGLFGGRQRELGVQPGILPAFRLADVAAKVEVAHLGGETRGKGAGVKTGDRADATASFDLRA